MILEIVILVLISGALLSILFSRWSKILPRYIALLAIGIDLIILLGLWNSSDLSIISKSKQTWLLNSFREWIPLFNASIHLAMDGFSYLMLLLTLFMGFISVLISEKTENEGFFYFNVLLMISGVVGIFVAMDMLLFFIFWELMLIPIYLLIAKFGNENDPKNSFKLILYTQASGLIMLISIICLNVINHNTNGWYSFDFFDFSNILFGTKVGSVLLFGFLIAFFVKLPVLPFHGWFPSVFKEAPVIAITSGLLIKTGAYGIIRFAIPLFHEASKLNALLFLIIGVITILYGAFMAFAQDDLRKLAAYIAISHMGFIIIGLFSFNEIAWQGVILQMIMSAVSTSAILFFASSLKKQTGTCNISQLGGLLEKLPLLSGLGMFFTFAILGLPGTGNFIAEFFILTGIFKSNVIIAVISSFGLIISVAYSLRIIQKVIAGKVNIEPNIKGVRIVDKIVMGSLIILILWIGLYPKPVLDRTKPVIEKILNSTNISNENIQKKGPDK